MKWRSLLFWAVLFAALGAFVYFYEVKGEAKREKRKEADEKLFSVKPRDINQITLERGPDKVQIARQNGQWMIASPLSARADQNTIDEIARNLSSARISRYLSGAQNLPELGLQNPKLKMQFRTSQGNSFDLSMGEQDYSDSHTYVKTSTHFEPLLIPAYVRESMDKTLVQLRDRRVMELDTDKVTRVEMSIGRDLLVVQKIGTDWNLLQPVAARGDAVEINSFLSELSNSEAFDFVDQPESNLKKYGLDPPAGTLTITVGEGAQSSRKDLRLGTKADDGYFAKLGGAGLLFKINKETAEKLRPTLFKLRDKHLVTLKSDDLLRVTVRFDKSLYEFEKGASKEAQWKVVQPKGLSGKDAQGWKLWFPLEEMTAEEILDPPQGRSKTGLFARPGIQVTLKNRTNQAVELSFSQPEKDSRWVRISNSESVFRVSNGKVDNYISGLKDSAEK